VSFEKVLVAEAFDALFLKVACGGHRKFRFCREAIERRF